MKILNNSWKLVVLAVMVSLLAACGEMTQEDVVGDLQQNVENLDGYKATAEMTMNTGQEAQEFTIDTWYQAEDNYRVSLSSNSGEGENQIILKNEEGVFVLTPALDKSFKFQTEWPENSSQPYLYQSLVNDLLMDPEATFEITDDAYVFKTNTNYQSNNNLPVQEVHFDKETNTPRLVQVMDQDGNVLIEVEFQSFEQNPDFAEDDFTLDKNMQASANAEEAASAAPANDTLTVMYPSEMAGAELSEEQKVETDNGERAILTFEGEKNFTLVEEQTNTEAALSSPEQVSGDIVNLGNAIGALSENTVKWSENGTDFTLASEELTQEEMIQVARSVGSTATK